MTFRSVDEVMEANRAAGKHFFNPETLEFFNSRTESKLWFGEYFVTSEKGPDHVRRYTMRAANDDGSIRTVGAGFQGYDSLDEALEWLEWGDDDE